MKWVLLIFSGWMFFSVVRADDGLQPRVHFVSNTDLLDPEAETVLQTNVAWLKKNPQAVVILEGHCDEWGESSYNEELGDRRARAVKAYLIEQGIGPERSIMVVSFGEDKPLNPEHTMDAWRANRRVEFVVR